MVWLAESVLIPRWLILLLTVCYFVVLVGYVFAPRSASKQPQDHPNA